MVIADRGGPKPLASTRLLKVCMMQFSYALMQFTLLRNLEILLSGTKYVLQQSISSWGDLSFSCFHTSGSSFDECFLFFLSLATCPAHLRILDLRFSVIRRLLYSLHISLMSFSLIRLKIFLKISFSKDCILLYNL